MRMLKEAKSVKELEVGQTILILSFDRHNHSEGLDEEPLDPKGWMPEICVVKEILPEGDGERPDVLEVVVRTIKEDPDLSVDLILFDEGDEIHGLDPWYPLLTEVFWLNMPEDGVDRNE